MDPASSLQAEIIKRLDRIEGKLDDYQVRLITVENQHGFIRKGLSFLLTIVTSVVTYFIYRYIGPTK